MEHNKALDRLCVWQLATPLGPSQRRNLIVNSNLPKEMWYQWFRWLNTRSIPQCIPEPSQSIKAYWIFFLSINGNSGPGFHCWSAFNILHWGADDWEHFSHTASHQSCATFFVGGDKTCFKTLFHSTAIPIAILIFLLIARGANWSINNSNHQVWD